MACAVPSMFISNTNTKQNLCERHPARDPRAANTNACAARPACARRQGGWGRQIQEFAQRAMKANASQPATGLVAQCSATPATVAATPPCSATPFQTQISVRHLPARGGGRCDTKIFRGCSATPVLHLQNAIKSRKSAATRVARHM